MIRRVTKAQFYQICRLIDAWCLKECNYVGKPTRVKSIHKFTNVSGIVLRHLVFFGI